MEEKSLEKLIWFYKNEKSDRATTLELETASRKYNASLAYISSPDELVCLKHPSQAIGYYWIRDKTDGKYHKMEKKCEEVNMVFIKKGYNFWIGLWKSVKNGIILFGPSLLAFLANVPLEYSWIAGILAYIIKNYVEFNGKKF